MKLHTLATAGLVTSILSILAGAIVRATGSGDGCGASWPTCNGRVRGNKRIFKIFGKI